jgi:hypothetical protein
MSHLPSIYRPWATSWEWHEHPGSGPRANQKTPHGRSWWADRTCRVSRPLVGPSRLVLSCGGCPMGPQVSSQCPHEFEVVCLLVVPSIHVTSTCHPLICWGCFPWIGDMACMHKILGGSPSLAVVTWHGPEKVSCHFVYAYFTCNHKNSKDKGNSIILMCIRNAFCSFIHEYIDG